MSMKVRLVLLAILALLLAGQYALEIIVSKGSQVFTCPVMFNVKWKESA